jgi:large subunit ribosomal protein L2
MSLKLLHPITPGSRHRRLIDKSLLWKGDPYKPLTKGLPKSGGRNSSGKITVRHIGGGNKHSYRLIDFFRLNSSLATVLRLEYDPNRSSFIALIQYDNDLTKSYILSSQTIKVGDILNKEKLAIGSVIQLKDVPIGYYIHSIELTPGTGAKLARSAGTYAQILGFKNGLVNLQLSSGIIKLVSELCSAVIGKVSNQDHSNYMAGKAGITRLLGRRPTVKGEAMNPVDHPHGGRTRGGLPKTPWGKIAYGKKTVRK